MVDRKQDLRPRRGHLQRERDQRSKSRCTWKAAPAWLREKVGGSRMTASNFSPPPRQPGQDRQHIIRDKLVPGGGIETVARKFFPAPVERTA